MQLIKEIDYLENRLVLSIRRDERASELEAENRARAQDLFQPVKYRQENA